MLSFENVQIAVRSRCLAMELATRGNAIFRLGKTPMLFGKASFSRSVGCFVWWDGKPGRCKSILGVRSSTGWDRCSLTYRHDQPTESLAYDSEFESGY